MRGFELGRGLIKMKNTPKIGLILGALIVAVSFFVTGEAYVSTSNGIQGTGILLSYASGMTMLVLPCTLPMVFVIVPLAAKHSLRKAITMTLVFGIGVSATLALYGIVVAEIGHYVGITATTSAMWVLGGVAAYVFGLAELKIIPFKLPSYGGSLPTFFVNKAPYVQAFSLGLLLGNAGLGCPCPSWYLLLGSVAVSGSPVYGAFVGFIQGLGRITPILAIAVAASFGFDPLKGIIKNRGFVQLFNGSLLVLLGAVIVVFMGTSHPWFEATSFHLGWNEFLKSIGGAKVMEIDPGGGPSPSSLWWTPWLFIFMLLAPLTYSISKWIRAKNINKYLFAEGS